LQLLTREARHNVKQARNLLLYIYLRGEKVMTRISSTAVAAALAATLLVATAPAAQARNLAKPRPSASVVTGGWVDAALTWLDGVFVNAPHGQAARSTEKVTYPPPIPFPGGGLRPMTGSCIDPNGCTFGGGV
jgi:hypothetical protein